MFFIPRGNSHFIMWHFWSSIYISTHTHTRFHHHCRGLVECGPNSNGCVKNKRTPWFHLQSWRALKDFSELRKCGHLFVLLICSLIFCEYLLQTIRSISCFILGGGEVSSHEGHLKAILNGQRRVSLWFPVGERGIKIAGSSEKRCNRFSSMPFAIKTKKGACALWLLSWDTRGEPGGIQEVACKHGEILPDSRERWGWGLGGTFVIYSPQSAWHKTT